jgi:hypothetical protein
MKRFFSKVRGGRINNKLGNGNRDTQVPMEPPRSLYLLGLGYFGLVNAGAAGLFAYDKYQGFVFILIGSYPSWLENS